jgi:hypothetical protein
MLVDAIPSFTEQGWKQLRAFLGTDIGDYSEATRQTEECEWLSDAWGYQPQRFIVDVAHGMAWLKRNTDYDFGDYLTLLCVNGGTPPDLNTIINAEQAEDIARRAHEHPRRRYLQAAAHARQHAMALAKDMSK